MQSRLGIRILVSRQTASTVSQVLRSRSTRRRTRHLWTFIFRFHIDGQAERTRLRRHCSTRQQPQAQLAGDSEGLSWPDRGRLLRSFGSTWSGSGRGFFCRLLGIRPEFRRKRQHRDTERWCANQLRFSRSASIAGEAVAWCRRGAAEGVFISL